MVGHGSARRGDQSQSRSASPSSISVDLQLAGYREEISRTLRETPSAPIPTYREAGIVRDRPLLAKKAKEKQRAGGREKVPQNSGEAPRKKGETAVQVARVAGISHDTLRKAKVIGKKATDEVKAKLRSGTEHACRS